MPAGWPPATVLSSRPGKVGLLYERRGTQMWRPSFLRTKPVMCGPQARTPNHGTAARSMVISAGSVKVWLTL